MNIFGWITPKKQFFSCKECNHIRFALNNFSEINDEFACEYADLEYIGKQCQQLADEGAYPEWHCYECASSAFEHNLVSYMYKKGYIRVGTIYSGKTCCFEGIPEIIRQHHQFCVDLCEENGLTPKFEPRKVK